jgi:hypothetical protein
LSFLSPALPSIYQNNIFIFLRDYFGYIGGYFLWITAKNLIYSYSYRKLNLWKTLVLNLS